jgi:hypothetical protein
MSLVGVLSWWETPVPQLSSEVVLLLSESSSGPVRADATARLVRAPSSEVVLLLSESSAGPVPAVATGGPVREVRVDATAGPARADRADATAGPVRADATAATAGTVRAPLPAIWSIMSLIIFWNVTYSGVPASQVLGLLPLFNQVLALIDQDLVLLKTELSLLKLELAIFPRPLNVRETLFRLRARSIEVVGSHLGCGQLFHHGYKPVVAGYAGRRSALLGSVRCLTRVVAAPGNPLGKEWHEL